PARDELRLRGDEREGLAPVLEERGAVGEEPRRLDLRGEVRELHLDRLEPRDRLAERAPLPRVGERLVERPLGEPEAEGGDADPAAVEDGQELAQAGPPGAEQVRLWHPAAVEAERPRVGGVPAHLPVRLAYLVAGGVGGDDDVRDLAVARERGDRHAAGDLRARVGDELLGAVDDPLPALEPGAGAGRAR